MMPFGDFLKYCLTRIFVVDFLCKRVSVVVIVHCKHKLILLSSCAFFSVPYPWPVNNWLIYNLFRISYLWRVWVYARIYAHTYTQNDLLLFELKVPSLFFLKMLLCSVFLIAYFPKRIVGCLWVGSVPMLLCMTHSLYPRALHAVDTTKLPTEH